MFVFLQQFCSQFRFAKLVLASDNGVCLNHVNELHRLPIFVCNWNTIHVVAAPLVYFKLIQRVLSDISPIIIIWVVLNRVLFLTQLQTIP